MVAALICLRRRDSRTRILFNSCIFSCSSGVASAYLDLYFYNISQSSLSELANYIILVKDLKYIDKGALDKIKPYLEEIGKMLNGLISVIELNPKT